MIEIKTENDIKKMRYSGRLVAETIALVGEHIKPGVTTRELDEIAERYIRKAGARPCFKGYGGFPASICCSVNDEIIHGIPGDREILPGDIVSIDVGVEKDGFCGDAAKTFGVGEISAEHQKLLMVTEKSLMEGLQLASPGNRLGDISHCIQEIVEAAGFGVVRNFTGHGVGRNLHEDPEVPNYGVAGRGVRLTKGMVIAIEPMVTVGSHKNKTMSDDWTVVTLDGSYAAHFEHTVAITASGPEILTTVD